jgi:DNA-binding CsgD family transcriptional regulator
MELGYHVTLVKDATAAFSQEGMHAAHAINGPTGLPSAAAGPLSLPDAGRLLDAQPCPPRGRPRDQVLAQASGNPLRRQRALGGARRRPRGQLFAAGGTPLHHPFSYLAIADLAAAAARAERHLEAGTLLERALARVDPAPGPRLEQLAARARGLLAEPADAGAYFAAPLAGPAGSTWPFERAQLQLDYGEWLRRQRRINDAKPVLGDALEMFRRLGAEPWTRRAESELRACGVTAHAAPAGPGALAGLTAQQREIVILAGRGLSNAEIADRLFLSPRTVASHLYRSYPKLGNTGRHQLRDLIG